MSVKYEKDRELVRVEPTVNPGHYRRRGRLRTVVIGYVLVLWICSAIAVAAGIWSFADSRIQGLQLYQAFGDQQAVVPAMMLVCGFVSILVGGLALLGIIRNNQTLLGVFICFILFLLAGWAGIGGYCASFTTTVQTSINWRFDQAALYVDSRDPGTPYLSWMLSVQLYLTRCCTMSLPLSLCAKSCKADYTELVWNYLLPAMLGLNFGMALVSLIGIIFTALMCARIDRLHESSYYR